MARFLFWEPYNAALLNGDFRALTKAIRLNDPMIMQPEVRELIASQLENPQKPSTRTQARDGWPLAEEVFLEVRQSGVTQYAARKVVLRRYPKLNEETLKTYCRGYKLACREHQRIISENQ